MPGFSLGLLILLTSWTVAHVLTALTGYLLRRWQPAHPGLSTISRWLAGTKYARWLRAGIFSLLVFSTGSFLAMTISIAPLHSALIRRGRALLQFNLTDTAIATGVDVLLLFLGVYLAVQFLIIFHRAFPLVTRLIDEQGRRKFKVVKLQSLELITPDQITDALLRLLRYFRVAVVLLVTALASTFVFNFFPGTQGYVNALGRTLVDVLAGMGEQLLAYVPNFISLALIAVLTRTVFKLLRFFYQGLQSGKIRLSGMHHEFIEPTYQILRFLTLAFALVAAFPYIPGSDSPVFRGLSIFVGFLISLGSTSLVTNLIAGVVITYTRGLRIGDRVTIGESTGDVVERNLLVTRIRTIKNVEIVIPNGTLLNIHIVNYSAAAEETGVILNTSVTIGYDVPWRDVHQLLIEAAQEVEHFLSFPEPFVLQTCLDDYYVHYELNAYTMKPHRMATIYSDLHQKIQDKFNEAEIEILSPRYEALRDGQNVTIPSPYLPPGRGGRATRPVPDPNLGPFSRAR